MSGWESLGAALAGNSDLSGYKGYEAGLQTARGRASLDEAMLQARKARDAEIGRQNLVEAARKAGDDELANFFLQGTNPNQVADYRLGTQKLGWGNDAMSAARAPDADMNAVNRMLMVMSGKPADLTKIEGNSIVNPLVTPDSQTIAPTDLGRAMIGAENALSTQRLASAGASNALAHQRADGIDDTTLQGLMQQAGEIANRDGPGANQAEADAWLEQQVASHGGFGKVGKPQGGGDLTKTEIDALFGSGDGGLNQSEYRKFLKYQHDQAQHDPRFASSRFAARAWVANSMGGATGGADTTAPVPAAPIEEGLGSRLMSGASDLMSAFGGSKNEQRTAADAVGPLTPEQAQALPQGTLFKTVDGRILRRH